MAPCTLDCSLTSRGSLQEGRCDCVSQCAGCTVDTQLIFTPLLTVGGGGRKEKREQTSTLSVPVPPTLSMACFKCFWYRQPYPPCCQSQPLLPRLSLSAFRWSSLLSLSSLRSLIPHVHLPHCPIWGCWCVLAGGLRSPPLGLFFLPA